MITVALHETRHTLVITAPKGDHFVIRCVGDDSAAVASVRVTVTLAGLTIAPNGTHFEAVGQAIDPDGTVTTTPRRLAGYNLRRLPAEARLALREGIREHLGALRDPDDQLDGLDTSAGYRR